MFGSSRAVIRKLFLFGVVIWAVAATISAAIATKVVADVAETSGEQIRLERELAALRHEHAMLLEWVADELRPWVLKQAEKQADALPSSAPTPSVPPLPAPPEPIPSSSPSPSPTTVPTPLAPTVSPSLCLPLICEGGSDGP
jgi:hypothetical protein